MSTVREDRQLTFFEHLDELRGRIVKSLLVLSVTTVFSYQYIKSILPFLIKPIGKVVFTSPAEAFIAYFMLALFGGVFLSMPFLLYQTWKFFSAALSEGEKKYVVIFVPLTFIFFFVGCVFGYFVLLPMMLKFFLSFESPYLIPMINISKYISFVISVIFSAGISFELPLVIIFLTRIGIVTPNFLVQKRRHAIVIIFILSAVLTPSPDFFSQFVMAIPLIILYELSIIFSKWTFRTKTQEQKN